MAKDNVKRHKTMWYLVYIFVDILDDIDSSNRLHVDMAIIFVQKKRVVRDDIAIIDFILKIQVVFK